MPIPLHRALVLTALPVEYAAVQAHLENLVEEEHDDGDVYQCGQFQTNGQAWEIGIVKMGMGNPNAAQETERAIGHFKPEVVLFVGVAGGLKDVELGDVVVATKVYGYHSGKADEDFKTRPDLGLPNHRIFKRASAEADKPDWLQRIKSPDTEATPKVLLGAIAAGEQVVTPEVSASYQLIKQSYGDALAVEMESYGFFKAAHARSGLEALAVRGISDLVEGKAEADKHGSQPRAASHAAAFAFEVLAKLKLPPKNGDVEIIEVIREVPPVEPIHSTLPNQPCFFGRQKELASIAEAIAPDARTWGALIDGPGGIGKTALAVQAGHSASDKQFPLKLFLSAKVRELTPQGEQPLPDSMLLDFQELLKELARELNEPNIERVNADERARIIKSALANRHALLVIDNVETFPEAERGRLYQFLACLPNSCKAIVTSRRRSDIDARAIRLDRLLEKEALEFIAELAHNNRHLHKTTDSERRQLYVHTHGNPLLIRWVVGQLGRDGSQCRTINDACVFLDNAPPGNDPLEYVFGDLLDTFTDSEAAVLAALTHFTGFAKLQWLTDLTGLAAAVARTALEDLADRALLVADAEAKNFLLPRYAATYIRRKRPEVVAKTGERLVDQVYALVVENGYQNYGRFALLEAEWSRFAAALPLFTQGDNERLQTVCEALVFFLQFSGRWDAALQLLAEAETQALLVKDFARACFLADWMGIFYYALGETEALLVLSNRYNGYWHQPGFGAEEQTSALKLRGKSFELKQEYPAAVAAYTESLNLQRSLTAGSRSVGIALFFLAKAERLQGNLTQAEQHLNEALLIGRKNQDEESIAANIGQLAELALAKKQWSKAETLANEALERLKKLGRQDHIGINCRSLALALLAQNRHEPALPLAQRAVDILTRLRMPNELEQARAALNSCIGKTDTPLA